MGKYIFRARSSSGLPVRGQAFQVDPAFEQISWLFRCSDVSILHDVGAAKMEYSLRAMQCNAANANIKPVNANTIRVEPAMDHASG